MNWYIEALKKYAVFSGRSRRKEYWFFFLFNIVVSVVLSVIDSIFGTMSEMGTGLFSGIYTLGVLLPSLAVTIRRLHDTDRSGWWFLISLIPIIGPIVLFIFLIKDSTPGENRFGANPKTEA